MPTWAQLVFLLCAVGFVLALKGLSGPRTARVGNLVGAGAAVVACVVPFFYADLDHVALILVAVAVGTAIGATGAQRVQMTQMPQLVALFNGVGGGAAALVARVREELVVAGVGGRQFAVAGVDALTPSELRVARMAAAGGTNKQIAETLYVTAKTVENHLGRVYLKLGITSRSDLPSALGPDGEAPPGLQ